MNRQPRFSSRSWFNEMRRVEKMEINIRQYKKSDLSCAVNNKDEVVAFYILHKNFPGSGAHIGNALYAVRNDYRSKGIGKLLGSHSIETARKCGYKALQFNSVVSTNIASLRLWEQLGFIRVGNIPEAFMKTPELC
jgi:L-amino acid N-acyltransferase YncA